MKIFTFLMLCFWSIFSTAQTDTRPSLENLFSANINVIGAGVTYERVIGNDFTTFFSGSYQLVGLTPGTDDEVDLTFAGVFSVAGRYYYNRERRFSKGKTLVQNSGNYLVAEFQVIPDFLIQTEEQFINYLTTYSTGLKYGLRRNIARNLNYEFEFGVGYSFTDRDSIILPLLEFRLQYVLF